MNVYDCWHQAGHTAAAGTAAVIAAPGNGLILKKAAAEYGRLMKTVFAVNAEVRTETVPESGRTADGYTITVAADGSLCITGDTEAGALYGVYKTIHLLAAGNLHAGIPYRSSAQAKFRMINHWDNTSGTVERGYAGRSLFYDNEKFSYDSSRLEDYARLLASIGINRLCINNVNVKGLGKTLITEEGLPEVAKIAAIFRPYGITLLLSINFAYPYTYGDTATADPLDASVAAWWKKTADNIYRYIPDLAGFLVKADSEGEPGPFQYGRNHADGANMLAAALEPHGGDVFWRCFVYNCTQDWRDDTVDRARAAYDNFMPLDGLFARNVLLQIKHGPYDFQVHEPVSPLLGALKKTRYVVEFQVTQEYTGHQIDLCYLPWMWQDVFAFDTGFAPRNPEFASQTRSALDTGFAPRNPEFASQTRDGATIADLIEAGDIEGVAAVGNVGLDKNWTGHTLAQANWFGYGRLAWNPRETAADIAKEWSRLTFGGTFGAKHERMGDEVADTVTDLLLRSYKAYEKYNAPFGLCFMVVPHTHYGPSPEGYEFDRWGTYHKASATAIGTSRVPKNLAEDGFAGTGYTDQYSAKNAAIFQDLATCPESLVLFFHRLRYDYTMKNGATLLQNIYDTHFRGYAEAADLLEIWKTLKGRVDDEVYEHTLDRFERQLKNAREWRDVVNTYFYRKTAESDSKGRKIYP